MSDFFQAFGDLDVAEVQEPPTHGLFRVRREKGYRNPAGQFNKPITPGLLANLRLPADAGDLLSENGVRDGKSEREGLGAMVAAQMGAVPGPLRRGDGGAVDFYDGDDVPFDVKTPMSGQSMVAAATSVIHEMDGTQMGRYGTNYKSRVVLDTTFLTNAERGSLWAQLGKYASDRRLIEVNLPYGKQARVLRFA